MTPVRRPPFALMILLVVLAVSACVEQDEAAVREELAPVAQPTDEAPTPVATTTAAGRPDRAVEAPPPPEPPAPAPFVVHEWGTYTSLQGSDGVPLEGLHHTEEQLPGFVHRRDIGSPQRKAVEFLPEEVTQKLETPVIYFYADPTEGPVEVTVEVDFPDGVISEWYPGALDYAPGIGALERIGDGAMTWRIALERTDVPFVEVAPDDVWAPSRRVPDAMPVTVGDEHERFIFYRGLGRFEMPVTVTQTEPGGPLNVHNASDDALAAVFLLHVDAETSRGAIVRLGAIAAGASREIVPGPKELELDAYIDVAADAVAAALVDSGLYPDEARAMVDTWRHSYFATPGLRVLYVAPQSWADALLPLRVEPAPDEIVRTLVGRIDVLTLDEEQRLLDQIERAVDDGRMPEMAVLGRFAEPKLRRVRALSADPRVDALCDTLIEQVRTAELVP